MNQGKDETRRLLGILHTLMRMLSVSNREVERRLDVKHGTISRLLNGQIEAKLDLVLAVVRAIGLEHEEFFAFAYPERHLSKRESESARKLRAQLDQLRASQSEEPSAAGLPARTELFEMVKRAVREVLGERAIRVGPFYREERPEGVGHRE